MQYGSSSHRNANLCPFCAGNHLRKFVAKAFDSFQDEAQVNIVECRSCEAAWQFPLSRSPLDSLEYFTEQYNTEERGSYFDPIEKREIAKLQMNFIEKNCRGSGALLDVGSGAGFFVIEAARRGWEAVGVEPSNVAMSKSNQIGTKARFISGTINDVPAGELFDLITMWDVIEHVEDPLDLVAKARNRLRVGGYLIIETGNYQSAQRIETGTRWWAYQLDHRWYFSPKTLEALLLRIGFNGMWLGNKVLRPGWNGTPNYVGPSLYLHLKRAISSPLHTISVFKKYLTLRRCARKWPNWSGLPIMTMVAKYPDTAPKY